MGIYCSVRMLVVMGLPSIYLIQLQIEIICNPEEGTENKHLHYVHIVLVDLHIVPSADALSLPCIAPIISPIVHTSSHHPHLMNSTPYRAFDIHSMSFKGSLHASQHPTAHAKFYALLFCKFFAIRARRRICATSYF